MARPQGLTLPDPPPCTPYDEPCPVCSGSGVLHRSSVVQSARCLWCDGTGDYAQYAALLLSGYFGSDNSPHTCSHFWQDNVGDWIVCWACKGLWPYKG